MLKSKIIFLLVFVNISGFSQKAEKRKLIPQVHKLSGETFLYVIDRNGAEVKEKPYTGFPAEEIIRYRSIVQVRKVIGDWVEIGPKEYSRGYIASASLGNEKDFTWQIGDLNENHQHQHFKLEFISRREFFKRSNKILDHFTLDSTSSRKKNGILELKLDNNQIKQFIDSPDQPRSIHKYEGQFPYHYVVSVRSWEEGSIFLVDKRTGKKLGFWVNFDPSFPLILSDNKHIVMFPESGTEGEHVTLFALSADTISGIDYAIFNWNLVSIQEDKLLFWGKDGSCYFAILQHSDYGYDRKTMTIPKRRLRELRRLYGYVKLSLVDKGER